MCDDRGRWTQCFNTQKYIVIRYESCSVKYCFLEITEIDEGYFIVLSRVRRYSRCNIS